VLEREAKGSGGSDKPADDLQKMSPNAQTIMKRKCELQGRTKRRKIWEGCHRGVRKGPKNPITIETVRAIVQCERQRVNERSSKASQKATIKERQEWSSNQIKGVE